MTITPRLVARYPIADLLSRRQAYDLSSPRPRLLLHGEDALRVLELGEQAEEIARFPAPPAGGWPWATVAPDLSGAVFRGPSAYHAVDQDGGQRWEVAYGGWEGYRWGWADYRATGPGGRPCWLLRLPSGQVDRTLVVTIDAADGRELARDLLPCGGYERTVRLTYGQDGAPVGARVAGHSEFLAHYPLSGDVGCLTVGRPTADAALTQYGGELLDTAPDGRLVMTRDRAHREIRWHSLPDYRVTAVLRLSDFPAPGTGDCAVHDDPELSWGGFLDTDTAIVTLYNTYDEYRVLCFGESEWRQHSHWLADPATGTLHGRIEYPMPEVDSLVLLGDATWVTTEWDGLYRWRV